MSRKRVQTVPGQQVHRRGCVMSQKFTWGSRPGIWECEVCFDSMQLNTYLFRSHITRIHDRWCVVGTNGVVNRLTDEFSEKLDELYKEYLIDRSIEEEIL